MAWIFSAASSLCRAAAERKGPGSATGIQTNGTLLNDEMAAFFARYNFLLGVSLDGPEEVHNIYRRNIAGEGSYKMVMKGIRSLRRNKTSSISLPSYPRRTRTRRRTSTAI
jgi:uncharacterized protein